MERLLVSVDFIDDTAGDMHIEAANRDTFEALGATLCLTMTAGECYEKVSPEDDWARAARSHLNEEKLDAWIKAKLKPDSRCAVCLDPEFPQVWTWTVPPWQEGQPAQDTERCRKQFETVCGRIKDFAPDVKIGIHALPRLGGNVDGDLPDKYAKAIATFASIPDPPLIDWLQPAIYDHGNDLGQVQRYAWHAVMVAMQDKHRRPIYPAVMRTINRTSNVMPIDRFLAGQVEPSINAGAAGVYWWGADHWAINRHAFNTGRYRGKTEEQKHAIANLEQGELVLGIMDAIDAAGAMRRMVRAIKEGATPPPPTTPQPIPDADSLEETEGSNVVNRIAMVAR